MAGSSRRSSTEGYQSEFFSDICSLSRAQSAHARSTPWAQLQHQKYVQAPSLRAWMGVPPPWRGPVCTYGRAGTDAVRTRAREKRETKRTTDLQLLLPIARGAFCFAFLSRTWPCTIAVGAPGGVRGSKFCIKSISWLGKKYPVLPADLAIFSCSWVSQKSRGGASSPGQLLDIKYYCPKPRCLCSL